MVFEKPNKMSSREKILARLKTNQPNLGSSTTVDIIPLTIADPLAKFKEVLISIGGAVMEVNSEAEITDRLVSILPPKQNIYPRANWIVRSMWTVRMRSVN